MDVTNPTNLEITREFFSILVQTRLKGEKFMIRGEEKVYIYPCFEIEIELFEHS